MRAREAGQDELGLPKLCPNTAHRRSSLNGAHHWPAPALPFIASVTASCMPPIREGGWDVVAAGFLRLGCQGYQSSADSGTA
ncbi:hypothetical protein O3P69_007451 [Scylla paramamosain]|uniref:Uncharacterized protein n=1 Tax=Scylla paramamosain TaxID=85552 RepID=A0AAW0V6C9_SCYPA